MNAIIDKTTTALVVIDLQKGVIGMATQPHDSRTVVANAVKLAETFEKTGCRYSWWRLAQFRRMERIASNQ